jgi:hypothetical protein
LAITALPLKHFLATILYHPFFVGAVMTVNILPHKRLSVNRILLFSLAFNLISCHEHFKIAYTAKQTRWQPPTSLLFAQ